MYLFRWFGNVWQIGDESDYFLMIFVKLALIGIVLTIGLLVLIPWLAFKIIQWNPVVGIPIVLGVVLIGGVMMVQGG